LQIHLEKPLVEILPDPVNVRARLGNALREVELLRRLLRLAKVAETYRALDREAQGKGEGDAR
jgi:hypothetical protein